MPDRVGEITRSPDGDRLPLETPEQLLDAVSDVVRNLGTESGAVRRPRRSAPRPAAASGLCRTRPTPQKQRLRWPVLHIEYRDGSRWMRIGRRRRNANPAPIAVSVLDFCSKQLFWAVRKAADR